MKLLFLCMIVVAAAVLGHTIAGAMAEREKLLRSILSGVKTTKNAMVHQNMFFCEALRLGARQSGLSVFTNMAERLKINPKEGGASALGKALDKSMFTMLERREVEMLKELMDGIGSAQTCEQIEEYTDRFAREMDVRIELALGDKVRRSRIVKSACLLTGVTIAVLLA